MKLTFTKKLYLPMTLIAILNAVFLILIITPTLESALDKSLCIAAIVISASILLPVKTRFTGFLFLILLLSFALLDIIVKRYTGWYFHQIPFEIINILMDTNKDEVNAGAHFTRTEITGFIIILINLSSLIYSIKKHKQRPALIIISAIISLFSIYLLVAPIKITVSAILDHYDEIKNNHSLLEKKDAFKWGAKSKSDEQQTVVLFLGETNRGDYLHFNGYSKNTTPKLDKEDILSIKNTISQGAYTLTSTPMILTRKNVDDTQPIYPEKSIISAYKEAGFKTWYVSYLSQSHIGDNAINLIVNEADNYIVSDVNTNTLNKILSDPAKKKLIVYKTIGSHYLYQDRYPIEYDILKPSFKSTEYKTPTLADKDTLENTYANSETYSVDHNISEFITALKTTPGESYLAFISDHGTSIYDDGKSLYGGNTKGNYNIAHFYWFNDMYKNKNKNKITTLTKNKDKKITAECFLDTNLNLSDIETDIVKGCSLIDDDFKEKKRYVRNNGIFDYDNDILGKHN